MEEDFVPTKVWQLKKNAANNFVSVQYQAPRKKEKVNDESQIIQVSSEVIRKDREIDPKKQQELEMKRIRYEVMKFGMSGFRKAEAKKAKVALAISLGAKSSKNRKINYKKLKDIKQREKRKEQTLEQASGLNKSLVKHKQKKKKSDGILGVYGRVERDALGKSRR